MIETHRQRMISIKYRMQDLLEFGFGVEQWMAAQNDSNGQYWGMAIILENVFELNTYVHFFIPREDFDRFTDEELAEFFVFHITGYRSDSIENTKRKIRFIQSIINKYNNDIESLEDRRDTWVVILGEYNVGNAETNINTEIQDVGKG